MSKTLSIDGAVGHNAIIDIKDCGSAPGWKIKSSQDAENLYDFLKDTVPWVTWGRLINKIHKEYPNGYPTEGMG